MTPAGKMLRGRSLQDDGMRLVLHVHQLQNLYVKYNVERLDSGSLFSFKIQWNCQYEGKRRAKGSSMEQACPSTCTKEEFMLSGGPSVFVCSSQACSGVRHDAQ